MYNVPEDKMRILDGLNASFRFRAIMAGSYQPTLGSERKEVSSQEGNIVCEIIDKTTGTTYAEAAGHGEAAAFDAAIKLAVTAPKPLTPAQQYAAQLGVSNDEKAKLEAQVKELQAKLAQAEAAAQAKDADKKPPTKGKDNKPPVNEDDGN